MNALLAIGGWTVGELAIAAVIIAAVVAVVLIALRAYGLSPPPWVVQILWVCLVAVVAIVAIRFLLSL